MGFLNEKFLFAPAANFCRPRAVSPPTDMRRGRASGCRGLWPRLVQVDFSAIPCLRRCRWVCARLVASGAVGSSPASSHLCHCQGTHPTDAAVMQRERRINAASPLHRHACLPTKISPCFCLFLFFPPATQETPAPRQRPLGGGPSERPLGGGRPVITRALCTFRTAPRGRPPGFITRAGGYRKRSRG
jgi:hypothetical protein